MVKRALFLYKGCSNNARPLGIASGALQDSSLSASNSYSDGHLPKFARLNGNRDWCEKNGANPANTFIQVQTTIFCSFFKKFVIQRGPVFICKQSVTIYEVP